MVLDDIATILADPPEIVAATTMFAGYMPDKPDLILALYEYMGDPPQFGYDPTAGAGGMLMESPHVQIQGRGLQVDYRSVRQMVQRAYQRLSVVHNRAVNGVKYIRITPLSGPFDIGRDENQRPLIVANFRVLKEASSAES